MSSIDERVVEMRFNNAQFQKGVAATQQSLQGLTQALDSSGMAAGVSKVAQGFGVLGTMGRTVIGNLTTQAMAFGSSMIKNVLDPIVEGGKKRALSIEQAKFQFQGLGMDVEATMASALKAVDGTAYGLDEAARIAGVFGASGMRAGDQMTNSLRAIAGVAAMSGSAYADVGDIFTDVAGKGRLMGEDLNRLAARGVNAAAILGKEMGKTEAEIRDMVSKGQIDFNTFANSMDRAFGEHATKANETFSGAMANMRSALGRVGADFASSRFEMLRVIFNALTPVINSVNKALGPLKTSFDAVTKAASAETAGFLANLDLSGLDVVVKALADSLPLIYGIFRGILNVVLAIAAPIKNAFTDIFPASNLQNIVAFLARMRDLALAFEMSQSTTDSLRSIFRGLFAIIDIGVMIVGGLIGAVGELLGFTFSNTGGILGFLAIIAELIVKFRDFLKVSGLIRGAFAIVGAAIQAVIALVTSLFTGFDDTDTSAFQNLGDNLMEILGPVGRFLVAFGGVLKAAGGQVMAFIRFLAPIGNIIRDGIGSVFDQLASSMEGKDLFGGLSELLASGSIVGIFLTIKKLIGDLTDGPIGFLEQISGVLDGLTGTLEAMQANLKANVLMKIAIALAVLTVSIVALSLIDSGALAKSLLAITAMFVQLMGAMAIFTKIAGMQGFAQIPILAASLLLLAIAIGILTISVVALSKLSWNELAKGLVGLAASLGILILATRLLTGTKAADIKRIAVAAGVITVLAEAVETLSKAVALMGSLSWNQLIKGLLGVGLVLGALILFTRFTKASIGAMGTAASLILLAVAVKMLAESVKTFSEISLGNLAKGLGAMAIVLATLAGFVAITRGSAGLILTATGLVILAAAMKQMAGVIGELGSMDTGSLIRGLVGLAAALLIIAGAMHLMPKGMIFTAASLVLVAFALGMMADSLVKMGGMSWDEIARGLVLLAGSLIIIAAATYAMSSALPGAAALFVVAAAISMLGPVLKTFGSMSLAEIGKSLLMLAGAFVVLGLSAVVLAPLAPVLALLGAVLLAVGIGMVLAGIGALAFAAGITALAAASSVGGAAIALMIMTIAKAIPFLMAQIAQGLIEMAKTLAGGGAAFADAATTLLLALITAIGRVIPEVANLVRTLLLAIIGVLKDVIPELIRTVALIVQTHASELITTVEMIALQMIATLERVIPQAVEALVTILRSVIDGANEILPELIAVMGTILNSLAEVITTYGPNIMFAFATAITTGGPAIVMAFAAILNALITAIQIVIPRILETFSMILRGVIGIINEHIPAAIAAFDRILNALIGVIERTTPRIIAAGFAIVTGFIRELTKAVPLAADAALSMILALLNAIANRIPAIVRAAADIVVAFMRGISSEVPRIADEGAKMVISLINGITRAINNNAGEMRAAGRGLGFAIIDGLTGGLASRAGRIYSEARRIATTALAQFNAIFQIRSPSRVTHKMGQQLDMGLAGGLRASSGLVASATSEVGNLAVNSLRSAVAGVADRILDDVDLHPKITPVVDLTQFKKDSAKLGAMMGEHTLPINSTLISASEIARSDRLANRVPTPVAPVETAPRTIEVSLNQTNMSPKALTTAEIYRQTNNQLSTLKGALNF